MSEYVPYKHTSESSSNTKQQLQTPSATMVSAGVRVSSGEQAGQQTTRADEIPGQVRLDPAHLMQKDSLEKEMQKLYKEIEER